MHYSRIAIAATPLLFAYASAYGKAVIKNSCGEDVYFWSCGDQPGEMTVVKAGTSHSEEYFTKDSGGGPSLKIATKYPSGSKKGKIPDIWDQPVPEVTQFEYTVGTQGPPDHAVFYDISNINGYPFVAGGVKVTSSDGSVNVECHKGVRYCQKAYNAPKDDHATGSAPDDVDLTMELCYEASGMILTGDSAGSEGSNTESGGEASGDSTPEQPSPKPSSSAPIVPSSPKESGSQQNNKDQNEDKDDSPIAAPQKLAVAPVNENPSPVEQKDHVVWVTTTAEPVIVSVFAGQKEKRHEHAHQHVHQKINKRRHGN